MTPLDALIRLVDHMREPQPLERLMQLIADETASIIGAPRVSVRLLDPGRTTLLAVARAGRPLHDRPVVFSRGEGLLGWIVDNGQPIRLADAALDPRFVSRPGMTGEMGAFLGVPIRTGVECSGVIGVADTQRSFDEQDEKLLMLVAALCGPYLEIARLSRLSRVDPLTGALNRRGLDDGLLADDEAVPSAVVLLDIDYFKRVNDSHGHATGDLVLRHVAAVCSDALRAGDAIVRYGGEEFLLVLPGVDRLYAARIAERVRATIASASLHIGESRISVTASLGVAERRADESRDELIARADAALYRAKQAGRDRVELSEP